MRLALTVMLSCVSLLLRANVAHAQMNIVPEPRQIVADGGTFALHRDGRCMAVRYGTPVNGLQTWVFEDEIIVRCG